MAKVNELLSTRFKKASNTFSKASNLAELSSSGNLSSFSGIFKVSPLTKIEEETLKNLLSEFSTETQEITLDLKSLSSITSEVKAINNQAAILHGERIKRAQGILKKYKDGAFSAWLQRTYGNRQTPYNFLQYYELYIAMPKPLQEKVEEMPRQAVYTLATRKCRQEEKETVIQNYKGETKKELLKKIRELFPIRKKDKRASDLADTLIGELEHIESETKSHLFTPSKSQKSRVLELLISIQKRLQ